MIFQQQQLLEEFNYLKNRLDRCNFKKKIINMVWILSLLIMPLFYYLDGKINILLGFFLLITMLTFSRFYMIQIQSQVFQINRDLSQATHSLEKMDLSTIINNLKDVLKNLIEVGSKKETVTLTKSLISLEHINLQDKQCHALIIANAYEAYTNYIYMIEEKYFVNSI